MRGRHAAGVRDGCENVREGRGRKGSVHGFGYREKDSQKENRDLRSLTAPTGCLLNIVFFP